MQARRLGFLDVVNLPAPARAGAAIPGRPARDPLPQDVLGQVGAADRDVVRAVLQLGQEQRLLPELDEERLPPAELVRPLVGDEPRLDRVEQLAERQGSDGRRPKSCSVDRSGKARCGPTRKRGSAALPELPAAMTQVPAVLGQVRVDRRPPWPARVVLIDVNVSAEVTSSRPLEVGAWFAFLALATLIVEAWAFHRCRSAPRTGPASFASLPRAPREREDS